GERRTHVAPLAHRDRCQPLCSRSITQVQQVRAALPSGLVHAPPPGSGSPPRWRNCSSAVAPRAKIWISCRSRGESVNSPPAGRLADGGRLPEALRLGKKGIEAVWPMHPAEYHRIMIHGREVETPRWQQACGEDYHYTGQTNKALPVPAALEPLHAWAHSAID